MILKNLGRKDRIGTRNKCATGGCPYGKTIEDLCDICYAKKKGAEQNSQSRVSLKIREQKNKDKTPKKR